jgi:hypothetical protein
MNKAVGSPVLYYAEYEAGIGTYTYYDPLVECGSAAYPFEITAFSLSLYDDGAGMVWPAQFDVVVYDVAQFGDSCSGPGTEICRIPVTAEAGDFLYPGVGTVPFPTECCVYSPVYIGVEYTSGTVNATPSVLFDNTPSIVCHNWMKENTYQEWNDFWSTAPGYPMFQIDGDTESGDCPVICDCAPGDANNDGAVNVGDAVYIIGYVFKGGPPPTPYPVCNGDANCDCACNVGDAVFVINYVFKGGPPPCDCPTWVINCGLPLRK